MVCASIGCPPLRNEPYDGNNLDKQLDDQVMIFLEKNLSLDGEEIKISSVFEWFYDDFGGEKGVIDFLSHYLTEINPSRAYKLTFMDWDWSLNEYK